MWVCVQIHFLNTEFCMRKYTNRFFANGNKMKYESWICGCHDYKYHDMEILLSSPSIKIPLPKFLVHQKKHGFEVEASFCLGLPREHGKLLSTYLEWSLNEESSGTHPEMGMVVSEAHRNLPNCPFWLSSISKPRSSLAVSYEWQSIK